MGQKFYSIKVSKPKLMLQLIRGVRRIFIVDSQYFSLWILEIAKDSKFLNYYFRKKTNLVTLYRHSWLKHQQIATLAWNY